MSGPLYAGILIGVGVLIGVVGFALWLALYIRQPRR